MKKILCLCLVAIMLISTLVSCNDTTKIDDTVSTDGVTTEGTTAPVTDEAIETQDAIKEYDLSKFVIVYGDLSNMQIATDLRAKIKSEFNVTLTMRRATDSNEAELELVVGASPREVSSLCFDAHNIEYLTASGIVCDNGKVQLLGIDRMTIDASVEYFIANNVNKDTLVVTMPDKGACINEITHESISIPERADASYVRLVTNNILSQNITASWDRAFGLIGACVYMDADIYTFQEVDKPWHSTYGLTDRMEWLGYSLVTDNTNSPNPIFYKTEKFDLVAGGYDKYDIEILEGTEDRYYSWACLKEKATGKQFIVIGTHLIASGNGMSTEAKENRELHRQESAKQLTEIVAKLQTKYNCTAAVVAGDFNSYTSSVAYSTLSKAMDSARDKCESKVNMDYNTPTLLGKEPEKTERFIDHVFYSKSGITAKHFETVVSPYTYVYSDHVPALLDFELN